MTFLIRKQGAEKGAGKGKKEMKNSFTLRAPSSVVNHDALFESMGYAAPVPVPVPVEAGSGHDDEGRTTTPTPKAPKPRAAGSTARSRIEERRQKLAARRKLVFESESHEAEEAANKLDTVLSDVTAASGDSNKGPQRDWFVLNARRAASAQDSVAAVKKLAEDAAKLNDREQGWFADSVHDLQQASEALESGDEQGALSLLAAVVLREESVVDKARRLQDAEEAVAAGVANESALHALQDDIHESVVELQRAAREVRRPLAERQLAASVLEAVESEARVRPATSTAAGTEKATVSAMVTELRDVLQQALAPLVKFVGLVNVYVKQSNDARDFWRWDPTNRSVDERIRALVADADSMEDFVRANRHLGDTLLRAFMMPLTAPVPAPFPASFPAPFPGAGRRGGGREKRPRTAGREGRGGIEGDTDMAALIQGRPHIDLDNLDYELQQLQGVREQRGINVADMESSVRRWELELQQAQGGPLLDIEHRLAEARTALAAARGVELLGRTPVERRFAPAWVFAVLNVAVFRQLLADTCMAAIEAGWSHVQRLPGCSHFGIKELIASSEVNDRFAFVVGYSYLSMGEGASHGGGGAGRRRTDRYLNLMHARQTLASKMDTCNVWFESVRRSPNPVLARFRQVRAALQARLDSDKDASQDERDAFRERMDFFERHLPQWELVYRE
jgi:hypothetical protein